MITGYLIADEAVPATAQTEASAWINTLVNLGASIGAGVAGIAIDGFSPEALLWATAILTGAGVLVLPRRRLRSGQQSDAHAVISGAVGDPQQRDQA